jgi:hypothetical protein
LAGVSRVSSRYEPVRLLSLCCVNTAPGADWCAICQLVTGVATLCPSALWVTLTACQSVAGDYEKIQGV